MPPIMFQLNSTKIRAEVLFEQFQNGRHGGHLGYRYETVLALLNLYVTPMPSTKFGLEPT